MRPTKRQRRQLANGRCTTCDQRQTECERCDTAGVCACCPCECAFVDVSPQTKARMARYDAAMERRERTSTQESEE